MRGGSVAVLVALAACGAAHAEPPPGPDPDLDRIPSLAGPPPAQRDSPVTSHLYMQGDLTLRATRDGLAVPSPASGTAWWETRAFIDARITAPINDTLTLTYSGRLNLRAEDDLPARETVRNDLREAYLSWQAPGGLVLQAGRINLKLGAAVGFNPTDYFKTRAVVEPVSSDPTVLREDRLGTAMLLGQVVWPKVSLTLALAPKLASDSPPYLDTNLPRFNPMVDRTNARIRALARLGFQAFGDLGAEVLGYAEAGRPRLGLNLTRGIGPATIAYLEWSGGRRASLAYDAYQDGVTNQVLPAEAPIPVTSAQAFANDLAVGVGYTTKLGLHLDVEYDFHQAGFSDADWRRWFNATRSGDPSALAALWFLRGYAADQQEPTMRHSLFLRADWRNAFIRDLTVTGFADVDLRDGSTAGQLTVDYYLSPAWTMGALVDLTFGKTRSNYGSLPQTGALLIKFTRYMRAK